jgi:hypothetical protein
VYSHQSLNDMFSSYSKHVLYIQIFGSVMKLQTTHDTAAVANDANSLLPQRTESKPKSRAYQVSATKCYFCHHKIELPVYV